MKVLITGAAGQVGRALLARIPTGCSAVPLSHGDLDVADAGAVTSTMRRLAPDLVINAAAYTAVDRAEREQKDAYRINAQAPQYLASAARDIGARLVQISTDFVFDGAASLPYSPDATPHPLSVYGASKLVGEQAVLRILGQRAVVLRTAWVYSAQGPNFLLTMLRLMAADGSVRVVSDQVGTPTAAGSVARAIWAIAARPGIEGVLHWTDAGVASWYDFAVAIAEEAMSLGLLRAGVAVHPISTSEYPTAATRPSYSVLDKRSSMVALALTADHWRVALREVLSEILHA